MITGTQDSCGGTDMKNLCKPLKEMVESSSNKDSFQLWHDVLIWVSKGHTTKIRRIINNGVTLLFWDAKPKNMNYRSVSGVVTEEFFTKEVYEHIQNPNVYGG